MPSVTRSTPTRLALDLALAAVLGFPLLTGCGGDDGEAPAETGQNTGQPANGPPPSVDFLGLAEDTERTYEEDVPAFDPSFQEDLKGKVTMTVVQPARYEAYLDLKRLGKPLYAEERHGDYVYYAIEREELITLPATDSRPVTRARLSVVERYKAKVQKPAE